MLGKTVEKGDSISRDKSNLIQERCVGCDVDIE